MYVMYNMMFGVYIMCAYYVFGPIYRERHSVRMHAYML